MDEYFILGLSLVCIIFFVNVLILNKEVEEIKKEISGGKLKCQKMKKK